MMTVDYGDLSISEITLALLEDTGYYKVNYYTGGLHRFDKNMGCDFLDTKCVDKETYTTKFPQDFCLIQDARRCSSGNINRKVVILLIILLF